MYMNVDCAWRWHSSDVMLNPIHLPQVDHMTLEELLQQWEGGLLHALRVSAAMSGGTPQCVHEEWSVAMRCCVHSSSMHN